MASATSTIFVVRPLFPDGVPACLLLLNKHKPAERQGKTLMIWASRHFQKANPQNLLRPSDLMRILVPWRAFGDLDTAKRLLDSHAAQLTREVEAHRDQRLADIEDAFGLVLAPLKDLEGEQSRIDALDLKVKAVNEAIDSDHPWFHPLVPLKAEVDRVQARIDVAGHGEKAAMKARLVEPKRALDEARKQLVAAIRERGKQVSRAVKELKKLQEERDAREQEIRLAAEREIAHLIEAKVDLRRILDDPDEARRYFAVVDKAEIAENEFNLNLPRYVDTFEPEKVVPLPDAVRILKASRDESAAVLSQLDELLAGLKK